MRPAEVADDQIIEAGKQLLENGRRATGFALRKIVGGGSPSRLARVWEDYRRSLEVVESEPVQELPMEVEEALNEMTSSFLEQVRGLALNLNTRAVKTAERRVSDVMRSAKEQQESAEAELVDAGTTVEDLEEQLSFERAEKAKANEGLQKTHHELEAMKKTTATLERNLAVSQEKLERERGQRESAETGRKELQARNSDLQLDKDDLRKERDELKKDLSKLQSRVDNIVTERETLVTANRELKTQLASQNERVEISLQQIDQLKVERDEGRKSHEDSGRKALELEVQATHYKQQLDDLMKRFSFPEATPEKKKSK